ncbi:MAG: GNAT family N-acetyltransferase [Anaerolineales bacterium]
MEIRHAVSTDIPALMVMDHSYHTDHVWQMALSSSQSESSITFREVRLPRIMRVSYPRDPHRLADEWTNSSEIFIAAADQSYLGYLIIESGTAPETGWVTDLVTDAPHRRQGVATKLLATARRWCRDQGLYRLTLEMQSKNFPSLSLARKLGFVLSGYHDKYYPDEEIALFFTLNLR